MADQSEACRSSVRHHEQKVVLTADSISSSRVWAEAYDGLTWFAKSACDSPRDAVHDASTEARSARVTRTSDRSITTSTWTGCLHWIGRMKRAIRTLCWRFSADRMVMDYVRNAYSPLPEARAQRPGGSKAIPTTYHRNTENRFAFVTGRLGLLRKPCLLSSCLVRNNVLVVSVCFALPLSRPPRQTAALSRRAPGENSHHELLIRRALLRPALFSPACAACAHFSIAVPRLTFDGSWPSCRCRKWTFGGADGLAVDMNISSGPASPNEF